MGAEAGGISGALPEVQVVFYANRRLEGREGREGRVQETFTSPTLVTSGARNHGEGRKLALTGCSPQRATSTDTSLKAQDEESSDVIRV
eukprot:Skav212313  [mRNA]  locus=scaffold3374:25825:27033:- [translate_table: standard]